MSYKVLVTGGAGFIGSHIVDKLVEEGHDVTIYDNIEPVVHKGSPDYINRKAKLIKGDVLDYEKLCKAMEDVDIVSHQAAAGGFALSNYKIRKFTMVNDVGSANILQCILDNDLDIKKLIVASSVAVYGEGKYQCDEHGIFYPKVRESTQLDKKQWEIRCPSCNKPAKPLPTDESKPLEPESVYSINKLAAEKLFLYFGKTYNVPTVALRYFVTYGNRQSLTNAYTGSCAIFSSRIKNNKPPIIFEDGLQSRDYIHVSDVARANVLVMNKKVKNDVFNVGTGKAVTIKEVADTLINSYGSKLKSEVPGKFRKGEVRHIFADISKIKELGFEPKVNFNDGIREFVDWVNVQKNIEDNFDKVEKEREAIMGK